MRGVSTLPLQPLACPLTAPHTKCSWLVPSCSLAHAMDSTWQDALYRKCRAYSGSNSGHHALNASVRQSSRYLPCGTCTPSRKRAKGSRSTKPSTLRGPNEPHFLHLLADVRPHLLRRLTSALVNFTINAPFASLRLASMR